MHKRKYQKNACIPFCAEGDVMGECLPDVQPDRLPVKNRFADFSVYCLAAAVATAPLMLLIPFACLAGIITGIIGLIRAYRDQRHPGIRRAWISTILCTVIFFAAGPVSASLYNYAQIPQRREMLGRLGHRINTYVLTHQERYPKSFNELGIPPEKRTYKDYSFYSLHTEYPYLFNNHLAGMRIDDIAYPERTILLAPGKEKGTTVFNDLADIGINHCEFIFVDGHEEAFSRNQQVADQEATKRFPSDGRVTDEMWFIKPQMKTE